MYKCVTMYKTILIYQIVNSSMLYRNNSLLFIIYILLQYNNHFTKSGNPGEVFHYKMTVHITITSALDVTRYRNYTHSWFRSMHHKPEVLWMFGCSTHIDPFSFFSSVVIASKNCHHTEQAVLQK